MDGQRNDRLGRAYYGPYIFEHRRKILRRYSGSDTHANTFSDPNRDSYADGDCDSDGNTNRYRDGDGNGNGDGNGDGIRHQIIDPRDGVVNGTVQPEVLYGSDLQGDDMAGFGGGDTMFGLAGNDLINGGDGDDLFTIRAFALAGSTDSERARTDMKGDAGADTILYAINAPVGIDGGDGFGAAREILVVLNFLGDRQRHQHLRRFRGRHRRGGRTAANDQRKQECKQGQFFHSSPHAAVAAWNVARRSAS